jgi:signal transduction histidine kinase
MNRRLLIQVTAPAVVIGLLLCGTCLVSAWYIHRLQRNMAANLAENVASLQAAQELEIRVRQLRFHCFLYLMDPRPERLKPIALDEQNFEDALARAREAADAPEEITWVEAISSGYRQYHDELAALRREVSSGWRPTDLSRLADLHPVRHIVDPCQELLRFNREAMEESARENERVGNQAHKVMLLVGILGPLGGLVVGLGIAQGLSRSIGRLSVRVQGMAQRLDQDVGSVSLEAGGDLHDLDRQLQYVVRRVEEVAERVQRQERDLLRAEQLAAVGQLAAGVAHEIRNPLTAVKMLVEVALRARQPKPLTPDDLRVIHGEVTRLERIAQGFLDFARPPTPRRTACDLRDVVAGAVELAQARARQQQVAIAVQSPPAPVPAAVDRDQVRTVLVNLFLNALDAMPHGGRLDVVLTPGPDGDARLSVADTGTGISPEMAGRLFTPFASSKPTGTGLGLSISRRIIEEHGGILTAANRPEGGACFTLTLPAGATAG